jgi:phospholipid/cholesterol/gamma-HCH transport system permease protein
VKTKKEIVELSLEDGILFITGELTAYSVGYAEKKLSTFDISTIKAIDGSGITSLDTSGAVFINNISNGKIVERGFSEKFLKLLELSKSPVKTETIAEKKVNEKKFDLESIGGLALRWMENATEVAVLVVDIIYWSIVGLFNRKQYRKGSYVEQAFYIGSSALPIIGTILFLIGLILALQSAAQLRQFGVTIFVVDLLAIGLSREFAPLMTAIIVSGRSGSAIASEIATMKFTEELDAIKTLGLNPIRFVVVPKFWAMVTTVPLLTIMALFIGLAGGFVVSITYMQLSPQTFFNELFVSLVFWDIVTGIIKSISFAVIITIVGTYRGLNFSGGADGVGRATTSSVVTSIFTIIVMDSIWGIIFYFKF